MRLADSLPPLSSLLCWGLAAIFVVGLLRLGVKLREFQVEDAADYRGEASRQSERLVRTAGVRGRILDRKGRVLAESRRLPALSLDPAQFQRRSYDKTTQAIGDAIAALGQTIGRTMRPSTNVIARHVYQLRSIPLVVWRGLSEREQAVYAENECDHPGFFFENEEVRSYPNGSLAAHLLGYVGRDTGAGDAASGGERFHFYRTELRGRAGLETYYDSYLRGVPGIDALTVDANGYTIRTRVVEEPQRGLDLRLAIDIDLQREAERQLAGLRGACVALDPRTGEVLAFASAPGYNPNDFVPSLDEKLYRRLSDDPAQPLLNRASGGTYAPGSTFKPITALAGLTAHWDPKAIYACDGVFKFGQMRLRCSSRWGHGEIDMRHALMKSCNPYFCNLATSIGTNALVAAARAFGLGERTGLDLGIDRKGVVPDADWKERTYRERWFGGDLVQMSIGQGMLLASPLQMARVAGAIGTGYLVTPRLRADAPTEWRRLPFREEDLRVVREGMRMVVAGDGDSRGTGWRGGDGVPVAVSGKTGTAEVGVGERRRKNTWFIAYAPSEAPRIAIAMVVENGESGGGTTAPKVGEVLKKFFEGEDLREVRGKKEEGRSVEFSPFCSTLSLTAEWNASATALLPSSLFLLPSSIGGLCDG